MTYQVRVCRVYNDKLGGILRGNFMKFGIFVFLLLIFALQTVFIYGQSPAGPGSEIYLFSIEKKNGKYVFTGGKNITKNPGYDNQPSFSLNNRSILYTSSRDGGDTNIYEYILAEEKAFQITTSSDGEYSPRELDKNTITFVREGSGQEMTVWQYDRATKKESPALKIKEPIGYYAWNYKGDALVWVRYAFMIHWVNSEKGINKYIASYAQPSIPHQIPRTGRFSFMERQPNDELWIREFDPQTQAVRPIVQSKDGKRDYCWMRDGSLLIGSGTKLYRFDEKKDKDWQLVADLSSFGIKDISRLAVSFDGKKLALVSNQ